MSWNGVCTLINVLLRGPNWLSHRQLARVAGACVGIKGSEVLRLRRSSSPWQRLVLDFVNKGSEHLHFARPSWHTIGSPLKRTVRLHGLILSTVLEDVNKSLHRRHPRTSRTSYHTPHFLDESAIHSGYEYLLSQRPYRRANESRWLPFGKSL